MHADVRQAETSLLAKLLLVAGCLFLAVWAVRSLWATGSLLLASQPLRALAADPQDTQSRTGDVVERTLASLAGEVAVQTIHLAWQHPRDHPLRAYFVATFWLFPARVVELEQRPELVIAVTAADRSPTFAGYHEVRAEVDAGVRVAVLRRSE